MSGKSQQYEDAVNRYQQSLEDYKATAQKEYEQAYGVAQQYTGDEGYARSLRLAQQGAGQAAQSSVGASTAAARSAGMTRAQAAQMGASQAANVYGSQLGAQQQAAYGSGTDRAQAAMNKAAGISGTAGNVATGYGNVMSSQQAEAQNRWNRTWGNVGNTLSAVGGVLGTLTSDERAKEFVRADIMTRNLPPTGSAYVDVMTRYLKSHGQSKFRPDSMFDPYQLAVGILVEQEHVIDFNIAKEIAKDHLVEDPHYYSKAFFPREAIDVVKKQVSDCNAKSAVDVSGLGKTGYLKYKVDLSKYKKEK